MAIANGTCVSFCNQPKAQFGYRYLARFTPICRCLHPCCGWRRPQESLRHILTSPGYVPVTIAVNVTQFERGFNACQTPRCIYPSIFILQPFLRYSKLLVENCDILLLLSFLVLYYIILYYIILYYQ